MNKKALIIIGSLVVLVGILAVVFFTAKPKAPSPGQSIQPVEISKLLSPQTAYDLALVRAKTWQADAVLASSNSVLDKTDKFGHSDDWEFLFVSASAKKKGFQITMTERQIIKAEEVPFVGAGAEVPNDLLSQEEAIAYVHSLTGYENQEILGIELFYNKDAKEWRWGVKTSKGTVSFKASR